MIVAQQTPTEQKTPLRERLRGDGSVKQHIMLFGMALHPITHDVSLVEYAVSQVLAS